MRRSVPRGRTSKGKGAGRILALALALSVVAACGGDRFEADPYDLDFAIPRSEPFAATLSSYRLFEGPMASLEPAARVLPYDLSSELFTDYASKQRLLRVPEGTTAEVLEDGTLVYPEGTVMAKTFYYREAMRDASAARRIIETRLLVKTKGGGTWRPTSGTRRRPRPRCS